MSLPIFEKNIHDNRTVLLYPIIYTQNKYASIMFTIMFMLMNKKCKITQYFVQNCIRKKLIYLIGNYVDGDNRKYCSTDTK